MKKSHIKGKCGDCLTGKKAYELDKSEPICPYLYCYTGRKCNYYVKIKEKKGILKKLLSIILK